MTNTEQLFLNRVISLDLFVERDPFSPKETAAKLRSHASTSLNLKPIQMHPSLPGSRRSVNS